MLRRYLVPNKIGIGKIYFRSPATTAFNNLSPSAPVHTNGSNSSGGSGGRQRHSSNSASSQLLPKKTQQPLLLQSNVIFKLPNNVKLRLCKFLDAPPTKDKKDWRGLAILLKMQNYIPFFEKQSSPTECVLSLWEVQHQTEGNNTSNPINELTSHLKQMGRNDVALILEKDVGPWV